MRLDIEFQQLEQFVAVARTGNFTRAAQELNLSQSALSRSIQRLEEQVGEPVFERKPRKVILTALGELLHDRAREILRLVENTFGELAEAGTKGRVRLGAIPTIAPYFLPSVLRSFAERHPEISVTLQEQTTDELVKGCQHGDIDLAILALPCIAKNLEVVPLFDEELLLVVPRGHELEERKEITASVVDEYPFVTLDETHCLSDHVADFCRRHSAQPLTVERTSQITTTQELVSLDHGISIVPAMAREKDDSEDRVYRSFAGQEPPMRTVAIAWNPSRYQSRWLLALIEFFRAEFQDLKSS